MYSNIQDVEGSTDTKTPIVERSTPPEWSIEEHSPDVTMIDWEAGTSGQEVNQLTATRADHLLDTQSIDVSPPREDPTSTFALAAETTPKESKPGGGKARRKERGGEERVKEGEPKHKGTIMKKLTGMFR